MEVIAAGVGALVPGGGFAVSIAKQALRPEMQRLRDWEKDKRSHQEFANAIVTWAKKRSVPIEEYDRDAGMEAASAILRRKGANVLFIAEWNLDPDLIARRVLAADPYPQQDLSEPAHDLCSFAVKTFYIRLIRSNRPELDRAVQRVLLTRMDQVSKSIEAIWDLLEKTELAGSPNDAEVVRPLFIYLKDKRLMRYGYGGVSGVTSLSDLADRIDAIRGEFYRILSRLPSEGQLSILLSTLQEACQRLLTKVYSLIAEPDAQGNMVVQTEVDELRAAFRAAATQVAQEYHLSAAAELASTIRQDLEKQTGDGQPTVAN